MIFKKEHELVRKSIKDFCERELYNTDLAEKMDREGLEMPKEFLDKLAKYKFICPIVPREFSGAGADYVSYAIIMEELSRADASSGTYLTAGASLVALPLINFGTKEQKEKYLKPLAEGTKVGAFGLTEPGAGSDAGATATTAVLDGDHYILNGRKCWITNAPFCDFAIVTAVTEKGKGTKGISTFIVEAGWEGFSHGAHEDKMGIRGTRTSDLIFENVKVPKDNLLGKEGKGFVVMMNTLEAGRIGVAAQAVGVAQSALDEAIKYTKERVQFGKPLSAFQNTQFTIADMATKVEAARLLVYQAAQLKDDGKSPAIASSMAKFYAAEVANEVAYKALQLHGGYGYVKDYRIERIYRDARILSIYEGTSQVQQIVIAGKLLK
ncbi:MULTISPECIES: putative isocaproyl-CoA dehydrogenase AcdB [Peptostreptococcus]|uniref:putative isocaproyl-CoA dehydrogenase AcdB n=1 Tax=Peptostreptococcus TaxID=1257 RepID=UPI00232C194D|nr:MULTISPECIES: putative isocaproyl-CoA dehydrogenase AcdB [Peptostreptococcus]MDB8849135.1 putative isocaproyl-CoA dehydrogenase AcdB [Peptostreptococcus anaerobius]MDB8852832.1 putative isocaproyl-CoA dehydrogenase AcdB [Peptostreptococcus anaerobius]MDB8854643.1 putative isocaproyl-CoA dehydrogenase AcdB [Peptostreptococcus anaerobius]MDU1174335.1 putative isocaproyl-CoA dehydrogenase AcdB [Peptostreptococcus anaerobius]MDU1232845.1 putative isocaproyl-CoA dehydrogenase AcdB [Peptostreptoc